MNMGMVCVLAALAGCKSDKTPATDKEPVVAKDIAHDAALELAAGKRTAMAAKTGFLEINIDLPVGASMPRETAGSVSWDFKSSKLALTVREQGEMPSGGAKKQGNPLDIDATVRTVTEEAGGYVLVDREKNATGFRVVVCRDLDPKTPPSGICCEMSLKSATPLVDIDKLLAFGTDVCHSTKVMNRQVPLPAPK